MAARILVIDDEEFIATTVRDIFETQGYTVDCAFSGREGIDKARSLCPDLLLCDVVMPELNGFETALRVKEFCPRCRLVFFSGYASSELLAQGFMNEYERRGYQFAMLPKPLLPAVLLQTVEETLLQDV